MRRAPVQARSRERVTRVLDAAEALFAEHGYEAVTTNQIATRANTSIGSIYEFFVNKQAIAITLGERYIAGLSELYDKTVVDDPRGRDAIVAKVVEGLDDFCTRHPGFGPLLRAFRDSGELQLAGQQLHHELVDHVERVVAARRKDLDPARRRIVAKTCANVLRAVLDDVVVDSDDERRAMVAELKLVLSSYLAVALPRD